LETKICKTYKVLLVTISLGVKESLKHQMKESSDNPNILTFCIGLFNCRFLLWPNSL